MVFSLGGARSKSDCFVQKIFYPRNRKPRCTVEAPFMCVIHVGVAVNSRPPPPRSYSGGVKRKTPERGARAREREREREKSPSSTPYFGSCENEGNGKEQGASWEKEAAARRRARRAASS